MKTMKSLGEPYTLLSKKRVLEAIDFGDTETLTEENIQDRCWTLDKNASFVLQPYPNHHSPKPMIRCYPLDKKKKRKITSQGIQNFALAIFGNKDYKDIAHQEWTTTCGNPYCMNPAHIVKGDARAKKLLQIKTALEDPKFDSLADFLNVLAHPFRDDERKESYQRMLTTTLLGEDYEWSDLQKAIDIAEGVRFAEQKRTPGYAAYVLENDIRSFKEGVDLGKESVRKGWDKTNLRQLINEKMQKMENNA